MITAVKQYWPVALVLGAAPSIYAIFKLWLDFHKVREIAQKRKKAASIARLHYTSPHWRITTFGTGKKATGSAEVHIHLYNPEAFNVRARVVRLDAKFRGNSSELLSTNVIEYLVSAKTDKCRIKSNPITYSAGTPMPPRGHFDFLVQYGRDNGDETEYRFNLRIGGTLDVFETYGRSETQYTPYPDVEPPTYPDTAILIAKDDGIHRE